MYLYVYTFAYTHAHVYIYKWIINSIYPSKEVFQNQALKFLLVPFCHLAGEHIQLLFVRRQETMLMTMARNNSPECRDRLSCGKQVLLTNFQRSFLWRWLKVAIPNCQPPDFPWCTAGMGTWLSNEQLFKIHLVVQTHCGVFHMLAQHAVAGME